MDTETRSLTVLNMSGDSTLAWSPELDATMRELIERKMKEGFTFFILKKRRILPDRKQRVTDVEQAMKSRSLVMADEDFAAIVAHGGARLVKTPSSDPLRPGDTSMSRDPAAIAASQSVAVRQMRGG